MLPEAHIAHLIRGRGRIRVPSKKGDTAYFRALGETFSKVPGIERVEVNPLTGSVFFRYPEDLDPVRIDVQGVAEYAELYGLFRLRMPDAGGSTVTRGVTRAVADIDGRVKRFTGGEMDLEALAFVGLVGLAVAQAGKGAVMVPAISALWYATTLLKDRPSGGGQASAGAASGK